MKKIEIPENKAYPGKCSHLCPFWSKKEECAIPDKYRTPQPGPLCPGFGTYLLVSETALKDVEITALESAAKILVDSALTYIHKGQFEAGAIVDSVRATLRADIERKKIEYGMDKVFRKIS